MRLTGSASLRTLKLESRHDDVGNCTKMGEESLMRIEASAVSIYAMWDAYRETKGRFASSTMASFKKPSKRWKRRRKVKKFQPKNPIQLQTQKGRINYVGQKRPNGTLSERSGKQRKRQSVGAKRICFRMQKAAAVPLLHQSVNHR